MFELVQAGGWLMIPILLCSVVAAGISVERLWTLRAEQVAPRDLLTQVWSWIRNNEMDSSRLREVKSGSPLGQILVAGITSHRRGRDVMKESIEEVANHVVHELERYLNTLGTVAAITPLLGLLGTVIGMIKVFTAIQLEGTGNAAVLAGGISEALITTAAGLTVAIPSLFFHRYFQRKVDELVIYMEQEALKLVEVLNADRTDNADVKHPAMAQAVNR
ncbi:MAG: MotA/TolQ/ExbB proton channel family protein [Gammaproteobacteria bacterium]|nr:MotA/TolQ/ExbB proton channel family protein [Gammaproteobacteria bacterium]MDE0989061.1 MotA/TolQ/ExbB proton channel family protein [Pseudomonadales bacterium]MBT3866388.1 MotA/TolQ/ExbB proton channel family protein [Gammaproteobacteria bacterium]MBT4614924.1 MotA/TolQ/ExbB proton channel family protein [Gammaproteobacteria bacterium]MBT5198143.1 MotA/TolQ/ExbB proton channel family protein [Gammaproteobacteria bacterium]